MNVVPITPPVSYISLVVDELRALADDIEAGKVPAQNVIVFATVPTQFAPMAFVYGPPIDLHRLAGVVQHGVAKALAHHEERSAAP